MDQSRESSPQEAADRNIPALEDTFRRLVNGIRDCGIYMIDTEGRVISWNAGAERIKGYGAEEIVGRHFSEFYTPEDRSAGMPEIALTSAAQTGSLKVRDGASGKTEAASGQAC
ncbi:MAG TPA: PAS domain S-box protein [Steroidobacteraceae bacterium]|jgi:PAS domain S-box-containing protein